MSVALTVVALDAATERDGRAEGPRAPSAVGFRVDGGYSARNLYDLAVTGADVGVALGATSKYVAWWVAPRFSLGGTDNRLSVWSVRAGPEIEGILGRVRVGIGFAPAMLGIRRAVRPETIRGYGIEGHLHVQLDCVRDEHYALFLRGAVDGAVFNGAKWWGPTIAFGVELGVRGKVRQDPAAEKEN